MFEVLKSDGRDDPYELGKYTVVAFLNSKTVSGYPLTSEEVVNVYNQIRRTGYYQVGDHRMSAQEFVTYVKNTITDSYYSGGTSTWGRH